MITLTRELMMIELIQLMIDHLDHDGMTIEDAARIDILIEDLGVK